MADYSIIGNIYSNIGIKESAIMGSVSDNLIVAGGGKALVAEATPAMQRQAEVPLTGKVVIITGASRGVGKQAAIDFALCPAPLARRWLRSRRWAGRPLPWRRTWRGKRI